MAPLQAAPGPRRGKAAWGSLGPGGKRGLQQHPYLLAGGSPAPPAPLGGGGAAAAGGSSILPPALSVAAATAAAAAIFPTLRLCVRRARPTARREERREVGAGGERGGRSASCVIVLRLRGAVPHFSREVRRTERARRSTSLARRGAALR